MVARRTLEALARKTRLPRRLRGPGADKDRPGRIRTSGRQRFRSTGLSRICILQADGAFLESEREVEAA
eukprot:2653888-Lingulodinium_polyedra.AAC.1